MKLLTLIVGAAWLGGLASATWLVTHDHPYFAALVLLVAFSTSVKGPVRT